VQRLDEPKKIDVAAAKRGCSGIQLLRPPGVTVVDLDLTNCQYRCYYAESKPAANQDDPKLVYRVSGPVMEAYPMATAPSWARWSRDLPDESFETTKDGGPDDAGADAGDDDEKDAGGSDGGPPPVHPRERRGRILDGGPPENRRESPEVPDVDFFSEGMRLIERADYAAAAENLERYRAAHPHDARSEDAAYLTIVALQRAGRTEDARMAARRYLDQYPSGSRRAEAQAAITSLRR
jgi:TolA-binding protein